MARVPEGSHSSSCPATWSCSASGPDHVLGSDRKAVGRAREGRQRPLHLQRRWSDLDRHGTRASTHPLRRLSPRCTRVDTDPVVASDLIHIRTRNGGRPLEDTVHLLGRELAEPQLATGLVLDRLVDVLLVQVLREWLTVEAASSKPSWLGALGDPVVGAAITRIHVDPSRAWTTTSLAREVAVSRSTLSRRFTAVVGMSPRAYVVQWRMDLAAQRLRDTDDPLESVAASVGYASVYAFSRAFRAARSQPPGRYRTASADFVQQFRPVGVMVASIAAPRAGVSVVTTVSTLSCSGPLTHMTGPLTWKGTCPSTVVDGEEYRRPALPVRHSRLTWLTNGGGSGMLGQAATWIVSVVSSVSVSFGRPHERDLPVEFPRCGYGDTDGPEAVSGPPGGAGAWVLDEAAAAA